MKINLFAVTSIVSIIFEDQKSPVTYSNQTCGLACDHPEIKGYLVPIEFRGYIFRNFMTHEYASRWDLDDSFYDDVPEIMRQLKDFFREDYIFELDQNKIDENTEAWIHLVCKRNKPASGCSIIEGFPDKFSAVLTWPNSD